MVAGRILKKQNLTLRVMEATNWKRAFLLGALLLASPWLLVQGWI